MKNKFFLGAFCAFLISSPVIAQDIVQETDTSIVPQTDIAVPAEETAPQTPTQNATIPELGNKAVQNDLNSLYTAGTLPTNDTPLNQPHIAKEEVIDWTITTITDILTVGAGGLTQKLEDNKYKFTDEGFEDLITFIRTNRITNANLIDKRDISVINAKKPAVVNEAEVQGIYRWLVSIALIVSSADPTLAASTNTIEARRKLMNEMAKNNAEHILQIQIVRVAEDNGTPYNIAIEMIVEEKNRKQ